MPETGAAPASSSGVDGATALFFFENSLDMLALVSSDGAFLSANPAWTACTGWPLEAIVGAPFLDRVHPDEREQARSNGLGSLAGAETVTEFRFRAASGGWIWLRSRARLSACGRLTLVARDVSEERRKEAELSQARRSRELLQRAAGVGAWRFHPEHGYDWSPELAALSPHLSELRSVEAFRAQVHPDDLEPLDTVMRRSVVTGEPASYEVRFRAPDGGWRHFRCHHQGHALPGGLYELHGISQEISDVAQARDAARREEARARSLIKSAPFAVALFDADLRYRVVSPLWAELFDVRADATGVTLMDREAPEAFIADVRRALAGESTPPTNFDWVKPDGGAHTLRWTMRPQRDDAGAVTGAVAYVDDISAFNTARREAESSARRLHMALTAAHAGVLEIDYEAKTFWSSPEFDRIVGRSMVYRDVTRTLWPIIDPEDAESLGAMRSWWTGDTRGPLDVRVRLPEGGRRWVRFFFEIVLGADGVPRSMAGLVLDIDEGKRQELALIEAERQAQAAGEAKAQFLANMSHEIRTPMNGVLGVLHLLREEPLSGSGRGLLDEASACGRMLAELLNDVIDFSRIEAGRLELHPETVDVSALVQGAARLLRTEADAKGLRLTVECPEALWAEADPVRLRQALFNLIGNAVKFTTKGVVHVRVAPAGPDRLRFDVRDSGPGIAPEDQAKLFARFQQVDGSSTRKHGGSGLGLAITRRLAEMMGGTVGVDSRVGEGACFTLEVYAPLAAAAAPEDEPNAGALAGLRILLVEDNAVNRLVIGRILESLGASVQTADDGRAGVAAALAGGFDLIFMDVQMPVMDGLEAVGRIRRAGGSVASTPVVALTANALAHQAAQYRAAGMDGVVAKPVSPAALLAEVARLAALEDEGVSAAA